MGEILLTAQGLTQTTSNAYNEATGQNESVVLDSGNINIQLDSLSANDFTFRAAKDIYIELVQDFDVNGFIGGLTGFDPSENITLRTDGTLTVFLGVINATDTIALEAGSIVTDLGSILSLIHI